MYRVDTNFILFNLDPQDVLVTQEGLVMTAKEAQELGSSSLPAVVVAGGDSVKAAIKTLRRSN